MELSHCPKITDAGIKHLGDLKQLSVLYLHECTQITDVGLKELIGLKNLTTLNLHHTRLTDAGMQEIQKALPNLEITR